MLYCLDVNHEMDCRTAWLGGSTVYRLLYQGTLSTRALLYFKSNFFLCYFLFVIDACIHQEVFVFPPDFFLKCLVEF